MSRQQINGFQYKWSKTKTVRSMPIAAATAVTTTAANIFTATEFCFVNVYADYTSGASDTIIMVQGVETLYFSPQRARSNGCVYLNSGDTISIKAATNYTLGWLRLDVYTFTGGG